MSKVAGATRRMILWVVNWVCWGWASTVIIVAAAILVVGGALVLACGGLVFLVATALILPPYVFWTIRDNNTQ